MSDIINSVSFAAKDSIERAQRGYLGHVDGLRAYAVIGVLLAHFGIPGFPGGFLGVDVFFVISGFLITRLLLKEIQTDSFSYRTFYLRRIRRLLPAALFAMILSIIAFFPVMGHTDLVKFLVSIPFAIFSLSNFLFYSEIGYFDVAATSKPLLHTWSLAVEEQFYFIWPTLLTLLFSGMRRHVWIACVLLGVCSIVAAQMYFPLDRNLTYYMLPFRAFELLVGALLACTLSGIFSSIGAPSQRQGFYSALTALGFVALIGSYLLLSEHDLLPGWVSLVPCFATALIIGFGNIGPVRHLFQNRVAIWLGKISYSLYLVHWPVYVYVLYRLPEPPSLGLRFALFPISILLATISYYLVEQIFRKPSATSRGNKLFLAGALGVALVISAPGLVGYFDIMQHIRPLLNKNAAPMITSVEVPGSPTGMTMRHFAPPNPVGRVLVLGDSHAGHMVAGLSTMFAKANIEADFLTFPGCPAMFDTWQLYSANDRTAEEEECRENVETKKKVALDPKYESVILINRLFYYFEPSKYGDISLRRGYMVDAAHQGLTADEMTLDLSRQVFEAGLKKTVDELVAAGKRVVLFSQPPEPGNDISKCGSLFGWLSDEEKTQGRCERLSDVQMVERASYTNDFIERLAKDNDAVTAVLPTQFFCNGGICRMKSDQAPGELLYSDDNHISRRASIELAQWANRGDRLVSFILGKAQ